jgi:hypothetical protein
VGYIPMEINPKLGKSVGENITIPENIATLVREVKVLQVGFTGTRYGCKPAQLISLKVAVVYFGQHDIETWHHGDCIGADTQFHLAIKEGRLRFGWDDKIIIHPPLIKNDDDLKYWAQNDGDELCDPLGHLARNREIVKEVDLLLATPYDMFEQKTGGTWYTVNYARKQGKPVMIIWPDGSVN